MNIPDLTIITLDTPGITDFASARNKELAKAKTEWVLFLDSDESLTPELESEIKQAISSNQYDAYYLRRLDTFLGTELRHGETGSTKLIRLARKQYGKWERPVHEVWVSKNSSRSQLAKIGDLKYPILHNSHPDISSFLSKINLYSSLEAQFRKDQDIHSNIWKIALFPIGKFKLNYLFKLGFLDGVPGLIMAMMMSFHSYLTWTKLFLLWRKK